MRVATKTPVEAEAISVADLNRVADIIGRPNIPGIIAGTLIAEVKPAKRWHREGDVIHFHEKFVSDGTTGPNWIPRSEKKGFRVGSYAKSVLLSKPDPKRPEKAYFDPTNGTVYRPIAICGTFWKNASERLTKNIRAESESPKRGWAKPHAELMCLLREAFSDNELREMGIWYLVGLHDPIEDSDGVPILLSADRYDDGQWLNSYYGRPDGRWSVHGAFVSVLPQVSEVLGT